MKDLENGAAGVVVHALVRDVMAAEGRTLIVGPAPGWQTADRKYLLDLYAECLKAVEGTRTFGERDEGGLPDLNAAAPAPQSYPRGRFTAAGGWSAMGADADRRPHITATNRAASGGLVFGP